MLILRIIVSVRSVLMIHSCEILVAKPALTAAVSVLVICRNSLVFTYFIPGIPIVFYGTEAQLEVQREPLWENSTYDRTAPFYVNLKMLNW